MSSIIYSPQEITHFSCSVNIKWNELKKHLALFQRKLANIPGDGYFLINSILKGLEKDYGQKILFPQVEYLVMEELYRDINNYAQYHTGSNREVIKQAEKYFQSEIEMYNKDICDVIICAAINALETNFAVFQNIAGNVVIIYTHCSKVLTEKPVFMKLDYHPEDSSENHYSAIVNDENAQIAIEETVQEEIHIPEVY